MSRSLHFLCLCAVRPSESVVSLGIMCPKIDISDTRVRHYISAFSNSVMWGWFGGLNGVRILSLRFRIFSVLEELDLSVLTKNQRPVKLHTTDCQGAGRFRDVMDSWHMAYTCSHTNVSKNLTTTDSTCCTRKDHMTNHHDNNHYEGNASLYLGTPTIFLNVFSFYARET